MMGSGKKQRTIGESPTHRRDAENTEETLRFRQFSALPLRTLRLCGEMAVRNRLIAVALNFAILLLVFIPAAAQQPLVKAVDSVGFTVSDVDRSVEFFSKVLSFEKVSETEVIGDEYEHLQGAFGLRMRVARMKLGEEFIELTEYLAPHDGRPAPDDKKANDLAHWQTKLVTNDIESSAVRLREGQFAFISSGVIELAEPVLGFKRSFLARDPDAHAMQLVEKL
jgi:catechol 2,3-dioxygenase-like lactoylglutathione lyase family enzyme